MSRIAELRERVRVIRTIRIALDKSGGDVSDARVWLDGDMKRAREDAKNREKRANEIIEDARRRKLIGTPPDAANLLRDAKRLNADADITERARIDLRARDLSMLQEDEDKALEEIGKLEAFARESKTKIHQEALDFGACA
jgi:hypothetical protein